MRDGEIDLSVMRTRMESFQSALCLAGAATAAPGVRESCRLGARPPEWQLLLMKPRRCPQETAGKSKMLRVAPIKPRLNNHADT